MHSHGDVEENAAVVNALERSATVVVPKRLAEGFGLTVADAVWKERPVVGAGWAAYGIRSSTARVVCSSTRETTVGWAEP